MDLTQITEDTHPVAIYENGKICYEHGHYKRAINYINMAINAGVDEHLDSDQETEYWIGMCYEGLGYYKKAAEVYRAALELRTIY